MRSVTNNDSFPGLTLANLRGEIRSLSSQNGHAALSANGHGCPPPLPILGGMQPTTLDEMAAVSLLDRQETKFVLRSRDLSCALSRLADRYRVLEIDGRRVHNYLSLYFDTPDFRLYHRHHAGGKHRYKVRSREYTDTRLSFLEVKHKIDRSRTIKNRLQTPRLLTNLCPDSERFVRDHFPLAVERLEPKLWNAYRRVTLVSKWHPERLTIDFQPHFFTGYVGQTLPGIVIAEVKYEGSHRHSDFIRSMREMGIRPMGFSKYCIGVTLLYPDQVKANNFKPTLRAVGRLMRGNRHDE